MIKSVTLVLVKRKQEAPRPFQYVTKIFLEKILLLLMLYNFMSLTYIANGDFITFFKSAV